MLDMLPINFKLLTNPANWLVVLLTVIIGAFAVHEILPSVNSDNS